MNTQDTKKTLSLSESDLARLGGGALAYIREIKGKDARKMLGGQATIPANARLFCLFHADGTPVSISPSREAAVGSAFEHELMPMSVH